MYQGRENSDEESATLNRKLESEIFAKEREIGHNRLLEKKIEGEVRKLSSDQKKIELALAQKKEEEKALGEKVRRDEEEVRALNKKKNQNRASKYDR